MSVQFGKWNLEGQPHSTDYIEKVCAALAPYGPDSNESYSMGGIRILYRAFHTTNESRREKQPHISPSGIVITWDGRLDNRADLIRELRDSVTVNSTDVAITAAAFEKWGPNCLEKLIGDWAVSIWNPRDRSVLLAKDPVGTKHLYYSFDEKQVTWSTILDPLVLLAGKTFEICEEYIAGWIAILFPAAHLTPYVGVHAVPPSSSVLLRPGKHIVSKYWDFDPDKTIRYRNDAEYEEHFRTALATAVQRRLRSDRPVLAELSGGMDSSSIVCIADLIIGTGVQEGTRYSPIAPSAVECPRLDTLTWFDESKPYWGELPHFTKVEEKRGRIGHHINAAELIEDHSPMPFGAEFANDSFAATPIPNSRPSDFFKQNAAYINSRGYRVTLSGIGGEFTGDGVPTPTPELQNLLVRARFFTLHRQLNAWADKMQATRLPLLRDAIRGFFSTTPVEGVPNDTPSVPWFCPAFVRNNHAALRGYPAKVKLFGPLPSFQYHIDRFETSRRFLASCGLCPELLAERLYPFLDRDFLEFMFAIPREQIVRVGQRRSLMKRALLGIVPDEILNRKKKENVRHETPTNASAETIAAKWPSLIEIGQQIVGSSAGIIDRNRFFEALQKVRCSDDVPLDTLKRTLTLESWLRHLATKQVIGNRAQVTTAQTYIQAVRKPTSLAS
jgi:asparagine synthase (glutamine-hydrolysing)